MQHHHLTLIVVLALCVDCYVLSLIFQNNFWFYSLTYHSILWNVKSKRHALYFLIVRILLYYDAYYIMALFVRVIPLAHFRLIVKVYYAHSKVWKLLQMSLREQFTTIAVCTKGSNYCEHSVNIVSTASKEHICWWNYASVNLRRYIILNLVSDETNCNVTLGLF